MSHAVIVLPDGSRCHSGPNCKRHRAQMPVGTAAQFNSAVANLPEPSGTVEINSPVYSFSAGHLPEAVARIEKANKRLERAGIAERFTWTTSTRREAHEDGTYRELIVLHLNRPSLRINGWRFAAAHEFTPGGGVTSHVIDADVWASAPDTVDNVCEACGSKRHRERVYWLKNVQDSSVKQVGSSCLKNFLGIKPAGLWALENDIDLSFHGASRGESIIYDRAELIEAALVASDNGTNFVSKAASRPGHPSTGEQVQANWSVVHNVPFDPGRTERAHEILRWIDAKQGHPGDYISDLRESLTGGWVKQKHIGIAVSAIAAYDRSQRDAARRAERQTARANTKRAYLAVPGTKLRGITARVIASHSFRSDFGTRTLLIMRTPEGHILKWTATSAYYQVGDNVSITSATVSENTIYADEYQTVLRNARSTKID